LADPQDVLGVFEFFEAVGDSLCGNNHGMEWYFSHMNPLQDKHEIDQCEWNALVPSLQMSLQQFGFSYTWDGSHSISAGAFAEVVARMVTQFFKSHQLPGSHSGPSGPWSPPAPFCMDPAVGKSVKKTAECLFDDAARHGGLPQEFPYLAGPDGQMTFDEWSARVGNTHASQVIFMVMASQEGHHADRADAIDADDWSHFLKSAEDAVAGPIHAKEFADYVSARATAELLYELADGKTGLSSSSWASFSPSAHKLTTTEWDNAYHYVNDATGSSWMGKVTPMDLAQASGLADPMDVFGVFEYFEAVGDSQCGHGNHGMAWFFGHSDPAKDKHEIDECEWKAIVPYLQSSLQQSGLSYSWDSNHGISAGVFADMVAKMVTNFFKSHSVPTIH
jgi:hypothetical protein